MSKTNELTINDLNAIKESLQYSKQRIADSQDHPAYQIKQEKLAAIDEAAVKMAALLKAKSA